jgi:hypothetical protein
MPRHNYMFRMQNFTEQYVFFSFFPILIYSLNNILQFEVSEYEYSLWSS